MRITLDIPDQFADQLLPSTVDRSRQAFEDIAVEAYRMRRISKQELGSLLGFNRDELDRFLIKREIWSKHNSEQETENAGKQVALHAVEGTGRLTKEQGVWVLDVGQPLFAAVTDQLLQQIREERDSANFEPGK